MSTQSVTAIELRASETDAQPRLRIYVAADGAVVFQALGDGGLRFLSAAGVDITAQTASIALQAGTDIDVHAAVNVNQKAGALHRTEAKVLDLHATEKLREDANGVGHTYTGNEVHYWTPWCGTGNRPHPPEHPYEGTDDIDWPPIDMDAMAMPEGSC